MLSFFTESIVRKRAGTKTVRGASVPDWSKTTDITISGCNIQPASTSFSQDGRVLGISEGLTAYLPVNADVVAGDRIVYGGNTYIINGEPKVWKSPTGNLSNMQLQLERWSG